MYSVKNFNEKKKLILQRYHFNDEIILSLSNE